jgi:hypothetical protein
VLGQASGLPRYETIREDIERLIKRNVIIKRVKRITKQVEEDFEKNGIPGLEKNPQKQALLSHNKLPFCQLISGRDTQNVKGYLLSSPK